MSRTEAGCCCQALSEPFIWAGLLLQMPHVLPVALLQQPPVLGVNFTFSVEDWSTFALLAGRAGNAMKMWLPFPDI